MFKFGFARSSAVCVIATGTLLLGGCAVPKVTPQARGHYDAAASELKAEGAALVVDACDYRLEVGTSHIYPSLSATRTKLSAEAISEGLKRKGVEVRSVQTPFVCGMLEKEYVMSLQQAAAPGAELRPIEAYPLRPTPATMTPEGEAALVVVLGKVRTLPFMKDTAEDTAVKPVALDIEPAIAKLVEEAVGSPNLWVVESIQQDVSFGRTLGTVALTAGIAGGMTGGAYVGWSTHEDTLGEMVALVNLERRQVVWKKQNAYSARGLVDFEKQQRTPETLQQWVDQYLFKPFYVLAPK